MLAEVSYLNLGWKVGGTAQRSVGGGELQPQRLPWGRLSVLTPALKLGLMKATHPSRGLALKHLQDTVLSRHAQLFIF